jgi:AAA domain-containing protein/DnaB helicase-like protein
LAKDERPGRYLLRAMIKAPAVTPLRVIDGSIDWKVLLPTLENVEAEQRLLGALLIENREFRRVTAIVKELHFANAVHGRIFSAIGMLIARGEVANPITLGPLFEQDPALRGTGGAVYLAQLAINAVTVGNAPDYARHVADLWRRRAIVAACEEAAKAAAEIDLSRPGSLIAAEHATRIAEFARGPDTTQTEPIDAGQDENAIPPRGWLLSNTFCRGFISGLIAQGAAGKSSVRLIQALSLVSGRSLSGEHVFQQGRVLIVCLEDGIDELRRRTRAAMLHHGVDGNELRGRLFLWAPLGHKIAEQRNGSREVVQGELAEKMRSFIVKRKIDLVMIDPLVKAHTVEENDNTAIDAVAVILSTLACDLDCAVDLLHHERKGSNDTGDANRARGASSFKDAARLLYTLTPMSNDEREKFGLSEAERRSLVRVDSAKVNIAPPAIEGRWFRIVGVPLGNGNEAYPRGDEVPTAEPWTPPNIWRDLSTTVINKILDNIAAGPAEGRRYSPANRADDRAAWRVVQKHCPEFTPKQCQDVISTWLNSKMLEASDYFDPVLSKNRSGLSVLKRPG